MGAWTRILGLLVGLALTGGAQARAASAAEGPAPLPRPASGQAAGKGAVEVALAATMPPSPVPDAGRRCTADGRYCVRQASYVRDVCEVIGTAALRNGLDPDFFARLIWQESLFDAGAVSPVGAQGIAQFMPGTARMRGLGDPFNPAEALAAAAAYLADLARGYGNIGLAAVAYNGGEARADRFVAARGDLPTETRAYVQAITGRSAEAWRDAPPAASGPAASLPESFLADCATRAENRGPTPFRAGPPVLPWGVIVASGRDRTVAERQVGRLQNRYGALLGGEPVSYGLSRRPGRPVRLTVAQVGRPSRAEAEALCARLQSAGGDCMVLKN